MVTRVRNPIAGRLMVAGCVAAALGVSSAGATQTQTQAQTNVTTQDMVRDAVEDCGTIAAGCGTGFFKSGGRLVQGGKREEIIGHNLRLLSTGRVINRFFETSSTSPSGRFVALFRFPYEGQTPRAGDVGDVVLVDLTAGTERVVAKTRGWEMQLGAHVQWGASDSHLFFNDVDTSDWRAFAVELNPLTGARRELGGTVFMATRDGRRLASYDLKSSRYAQVGYGVMVPDRLIAHLPGPRAENGVWVTDVATGRSRMVISTREIYERATPSIKIEHPELYEFYVFQTKWNPQGTRLLISLQWSLLSGSPRRRAVITMKPDGTDVRTAISSAQWARGGHHISWMSDGEHVSMNAALDDEPTLHQGSDTGAVAPDHRIQLISVRYDGSDLKKIYDTGSGHPSQHPGGLPLFITDSYPDEPVADRKGTVPIRLINLQTQTSLDVARVFVTMTGGEQRIDPHPTWDRSGRYVIFNGFVGGTRNVWMVDVGDMVDQARLNLPHRPAARRRGG